MLLYNKVVFKLSAVLMVATLCVVETRPVATNPPECRPGQFYDGNTFEYRSCSICFTGEGQQFDWNCKHCKCKEPTTTPTVTTPTPTTPATRSNVSGDDTKKPTTTPTVTTSTPTTFTLSHVPWPEMNATRSARDERDVEWETPVIIVLGVIFCVIIISVSICCCRRPSRSHQVYHQGCYCSLNRGKKPTQCTGVGDSTPSTPCSDSSIIDDDQGYRVQQLCRLVTSGKNSFYLPSDNSSTEGTFV